MNRVDAIVLGVALAVVVVSIFILTLLPDTVFSGSMLNP